jgi:hypothetical protein
MDEQIEKFEQISKNEKKNDSENFQSEKHSEIVTQTYSKLSSSKKRRIRKVRLMKSLGINISKFRKQRTKENRLGRVKEIRLGLVRKSSDSEQIKCKRNSN